MKTEKGNLICDCGNKWNPVIHEGKCPDCGRVYEKKGDIWELIRVPKLDIGGEIPEEKQEEGSEQIMERAVEQVMGKLKEKLPDLTPEEKKKGIRELIKTIIKELGIKPEAPISPTMFGRLYNAFSQEEESE